MYFTRMYTTMEKRVFSQHFCCKKMPFYSKKKCSNSCTHVLIRLARQFPFRIKLECLLFIKYFYSYNRQNILPGIMMKQILQNLPAWVCLLICILLHKLCIYKNATKDYHTVNILYFPYLLSIYHLQNFFTDV